MLCIGISKYSHLISLPNAARDARKLHDKLNEIGPRCKAEVREDVQTREDLKNCIRLFLQREELQKSPPQGVLIEYSGHGMQKCGTVYLLPGNADPGADTFDPEYDAFTLGDILRFCREDLDDHAAREKRAPVSFVVIIDACRDSAALSDSAICASLDQRKNTNPKDWAICFSCSRDSTAKDGPFGGNSPFVSELLHETEGIFAQGVPLGKGLNDACIRLEKRHADQVPIPVRMNTIPSELYLFPPGSDSSSMAGIKQAVVTDSDCNELVRFLNSKGLSAIAARFSDVMGMQWVRHFEKLQAEDLDDPDLSFLKRWQKQELIVLVQGITARSASLRDSGLDDSILSGADTASEGGDTASERGDDEDSYFDATLAKHPGNPEDFQEHMKGFITDLLEYMSLGAPDDASQVFTVPLSGYNHEWSYCMLVWMRFAKDAYFDGIWRGKWRECITFPSQDRLLAMLDSCLQQESTSHKWWTRAEFKRLGCNKPFAAATFVTDVMVQQSLKGHKESGLAWQQDVVKSWFANGEEASTFVLRANKFLREHFVNGTSVVTQVVETHSYVAFMRMTKLASLLLFAYLDTRKLEDAASGAKGGSSSLFHGFRMLMSSSGRVFSLTPADAPALGARPTVLQGLRCLARLSAQAWELLGPMKTPGITS